MPVLLILILLLAAPVAALPQRPLVLLHGLSFGIQDTFADRVPIWPWESPAKGLISVLEERGGYIMEETLFTLEYPSWNGALEPVQALATKIDEILALTGSSQVDIVGFSMGGVVARLYITDPCWNGRPPVHKVIMIATPSGGSPWAGALNRMEEPEASEFARWLSRQWRGIQPEALVHLSPNQSLLNELNSRPWPQTVLGVSIAGQVDPKLTQTTLSRRVLEWILSRIGEGDLVVPTTSAQLPEPVRFYVVPGTVEEIWHPDLPYHPQVQSIVYYELMITD